jgi:hypothetical protein
MDRPFGASGKAAPVQTEVFQDRPEHKRHTGMQRRLCFN